jgi:hypothetical protein
MTADIKIYSSVKKNSNEQFFGHSFFLCESFTFKFELNLHIILVSFLFKNWSIWRMLSGWFLNEETKNIRTIQNFYFKNDTIKKKNWLGWTSVFILIPPSSFFTVFGLCIYGSVPPKDARLDSLWILRQRVHNQIPLEPSMLHLDLSLYCNVSEKI